MENIEREISSAHENREEADKLADQAKKRAAQYEKKLIEIAPMVKEMERFAEKYSVDPEEVLPGGRNAGNRKILPGEKSEASD